VGLYGIRLDGFVGENIRQKVRLIPREKYPFKIVSSNVQTVKNIKFQIKENKIGKKAEYLLTVEILKKDIGKYRDTIILQTNSKIKPNIKIPVYVGISEREPVRKN
jgi:hypothetical protein